MSRSVGDRCSPISDDWVLDVPETRVVGAEREDMVLREEIEE
jgi:hypothetical protein